MINASQPASLSARDKVLATALQMFTRKGYFNTSMRDITHESGVSTGSVYHHFRDKEGVAAALYDSLIQRMQKQLESIMDHHDTVHDQCRAVIRLMFEITDSDPDMMSFMLYIKHREFLPSERPVCSSRPFELMREMVEQGITSGVIRKGDALVTAACLFGGAIRLITLKLDGMIEGPLIDRLNETWDCSWRAAAAK